MNKSASGPSNISEQRGVGIFLILVSAAAFGVMPIFANYAYSYGAEPITVLFLRFSLASIIMLMYHFIRKARFPRGKFYWQSFSWELWGMPGCHFPSRLSGWGAIGGVVVVSTVIAIVTFFEGLKRIGPVHSSMLSTFEPVVTVALAWVFFNEGLTPLKFLGGALILVAGILLARK